MKREELATAAQVAPATLFDFESGRRQPQPRTLAAIRAALEQAGVVFTNGDEPGVKLRKPAQVELLYGGVKSDRMGGT